MRVIKPCISDEIMNKSEIISSAQKVRDNPPSSLYLSLSLSFPRNTMATSKSDRRIKKRGREPDSALVACKNKKQNLIWRLCTGKIFDKLLQKNRSLIVIYFINSKAKSLFYMRGFSFSLLLWLSLCLFMSVCLFVRLSPSISPSLSVSLPKEISTCLTDHHDLWVLFSQSSSGSIKFRLERYTV